MVVLNLNIVLTLTFVHVADTVTGDCDARAAVQ